MLSHIVRPLSLLVAFAGLAAFAGCASPKPAVKVLGLSDAHTPEAEQVLLLFLEVRNPTQRNITLSGLEYELRAQPWFATEGRLAITRSVSPGGSTVLEIPVHLEALRARSRADDDVPYQFEGRLHARDGNRRTEYPISARGALSSRAPHGRSARLTLPQPVRAE